MLPRIAVFSAATATIEVIEPLATSRKAREKYGLPIPTGRYDPLRPQRLAAPVTIYVEQFSAHPLEPDAAELYAPPDGYVDSSGTFHRERQSPADKPVYEITLQPEDGLYPLPYMARRADGQPWEADESYVSATGTFRQVHYPDASRLFEEIDRLGISDAGDVNLLSSLAEFDFYRAAPSGGYLNGLPASKRTDAGTDDIGPERAGVDFFPYRPRALRREPTAARLAQLTNMVQSALASGKYAGALWLEGTPNVEESAYWLNLLIDTPLPIAATISQRGHGAIGNDGDRNVVEAVTYLVSDAWRGQDGGHDQVGAVVVADQRLYTARDVVKADARPGGYEAAGGHGGIVGAIPEMGQPVLTFMPAKRHTHASQVNITCIPWRVQGLAREGQRVVARDVEVKDGQGELRGDNMPVVTIAKHGRYQFEDMPAQPESVDQVFAALVEQLRRCPLVGFVAEGSSPYGSVSHLMERALQRAALSGMPFVRVGRGAGGITPARQGNLAITGSNLTANKARLLLMACLLRFGAVPPAADPEQPTAAELDAVRSRIAQYQAVFETH